MNTKPSPEFLLKALERRSKNVREYREISRIHQLFQAETSSKYAEIFYKTLFLFSSGAFVLLPIYHKNYGSNASEQDIKNILLLLVICTGINFISVICAYFSSLYGALSESNDAAAYDFYETKLYYETAQDQKQMDNCAGKCDTHRFWQKV